MIYLDNASTTRVSNEVKNKVIELLDVFGNPSSLHKIGMLAESEINTAREIIAKAVGSDTNEVYFTGSGTESNNLAVLGVNASKIITSNLEHDSVVNAAKQIDNCVLIDDLEQLDNELKGREKRIIVSLMHVNNETGAINDIRKIKEIIGDRAIFHVDCVQSFCKLDNAFDYADMISVSSHKIHGLKGTGALIAKKSVPLKPIIHGGGQERKIRSGTENVIGIAAFGLAAEVAGKNRINNYDKVKEFSAFFRKNIKNAYMISPDDASPYILNFAFERIKSEVLLHSLEARDVYVSTGSACSKGKKSRVLSSLELPSKYADGAIRISFSNDNNFEEVRLACQIINEEVEKFI